MSTPRDRRASPGTPPWLTDMVHRFDGPEGLDAWRRALTGVGDPAHRQSAVLILFAGVDAAAAARGPNAHEPARVHDPAHAHDPGRAMRTASSVAPADVSILLTERAHTLRSHAGQVSFPGGRAEPDDVDLVATALRETHEEVGVEPDSVAVAGILPPVPLAVSSHDVSPVIGWWARPDRTWPRDPAEVARVLQVPVADLVDPAHRFRVGHPSGWIGPAFQVEDLVVWGFTAVLLDGILRLGGWERDWDESDVRPAP